MSCRLSRGLDVEDVGEGIGPFGRGFAGTVFKQLRPRHEERFGGRVEFALFFRYVLVHTLFMWDA